MSRVRKINTGDVLLARFPVTAAERLLRFNITKQRVVDLCNQDFKDDPFDEAKNYSTWYRAMDGQEVWEGIVHALDGLYDAQTYRPKQYLPQDDPDDDLSEWMAQIAKATWWHKTLELDMPLNTLNSWFSGRVSKTRPELREKVDAWWVRVKAATELAELHTQGREMTDSDRISGSTPLSKKCARSWHSYLKDKVDDGWSRDEIFEHYIERMDITLGHNISLIDLADPQDPLEPINWSSEHAELYRADWVATFETMWDDGFPYAISRTPPEFDPEPYIKESKWGDRRNEECPKDLNTHLYGKRYRERCQRYWNEQDRRVDVTTEIVEVSTDGENWRAPNEIEKKGWDNGIIVFFEAMHADQDASNSYTQELKQAKRAVKHARSAYYQGSGDHDKAASLASAVTAAERALQQAQDNTHGQYD
jgi:hypothetical protein